MLIKARCVVRGLNPWECFKMIYDFDVRASFETIFSQFEVVDKLNKYQDVVYMIIKVIFFVLIDQAPWPVTDRDFLQKRTWNSNYKGYDYVLHHVHTEHPLKPDRENLIRAHTIVSGYLMSVSPENPNDTIVTIVAQTDVLGYIPTAIINYNTARAPKKWVDDFTKKGQRMKMTGVLEKGDEWED